MKNKLYNTFNQGFRNSSFIRVSDNHVLHLYIGKDENGNFAFEFRGKCTPTKISSSDVITVKQGKNGDEIVLRFLLSNAELLEYFCTFCEDLLDSTLDIKDDDKAYNTLCSRYFSWKKLFRPQSGSLSDAEIMGLIGELLFLKEYMIPQWGVEKSLDSWIGPEKTHKDFSLDSEWYEVKAISSGKDTIKISSLEQLDSELEGYLVVYCLEKMSPSFNGIKLNALVSELLNKMGTPENRELFLTKLNLYNFDFSPDYDNVVYSSVGFSQYRVTNEFPRLTRKKIPTALTRVQYDIVLSEINDFKLN